MEMGHGGAVKSVSVVCQGLCGQSFWQWSPQCHVSCDGIFVRKVCFDPHIVLLLKRTPPTTFVFSVLWSRNNNICRDNQEMGACTGLDAQKITDARCMVHSVGMSSNHLCISDLPPIHRPAYMCIMNTIPVIASWALAGTLPKYATDPWLIGAHSVLQFKRNSKHWHAHQAIPAT